MVEALQAAPRLRGVTLSVEEGEILGIAGVDGNGQRELTEILTGLRRWDSGEVKVGGLALPPGSPALSRALGVAHIPEDRAQHGVVPALRVEENLALGRSRFMRGLFIDRSARRAHAERLVGAFDIRPPDARLPTAGLSGGNQQKVVLARELEGSPRLIVAVQPTRGLDFSAVTLVHRKLREARDTGAAVLLVSLDLDEVLSLSDRVCVMSGGRIRAQFFPPISAREVGEAMLAAWPAESEHALG
jgi:simple sugar transport system ATP-binding protein